MINCIRKWFSKKGQVVDVKQEVCVPEPTKKYDPVFGYELDESGDCRIPEEASQDRFWLSRLSLRESTGTRYSDCNTVKFLIKDTLHLTGCGSVISYYADLGLGLLERQHYGVRGIKASPFGLAVLKGEGNPLTRESRRLTTCSDLDETVEDLLKKLKALLDYLNNLTEEDFTDASESIREWGIRRLHEEVATLGKKKHTRASLRGTAEVKENTYTNKTEDKPLLSGHRSRSRSTSRSYDSYCDSTSSSLSSSVLPSSSFDSSSSCSSYSSSDSGSCGGGM